MGLHPLQDIEAHGRADYLQHWSGVWFVHFDDTLWDWDGNSRFWVVKVSSKEENQRYQRTKDYTIAYILRFLIKIGRAM